MRAHTQRHIYVWASCWYAWAEMMLWRSAGGRPLQQQRRVARKNRFKHGEAFVRCRLPELRASCLGSHESQTNLNLRHGCIATSIEENHAARA